MMCAFRIVFIVLLATAVFVQRCTAIKISTLNASFLLGETAQMTVFSPVSGAHTYWAFVNNTQWGSFCTIVSPADSCQIQLPIPRAGLATVQVASLDRMWCQNQNCQFPVGKRMPTVDKSNVSNTLELSVRVRKIGYDGLSSPNKSICIDWEPWFTKNNLGGKPWLTRPGAEGVPILGLYSSFNSDVVRQHAIWFALAGVNCILVDWSNNLWANRSWEDRAIDIQELINATTFALTEYAAIREEGFISTPKVVIMTGLLNGPKSNMASPRALEKQAAWIYRNYILRFGVEHFLVLENKPVIVMLDTGTPTTPNVKWNISDTFTVRWMGTQLQANPSLGLTEGFWSWMDGSYEPIPAMVSDRSTLHNVKGNARVEALTVTPGFFTTHGGWLDKSAGSYNHGATFVKTMETAVKLDPQILLICQWNEFAGQPGGPPGQYVDSYNSSLTNDMEPISLSECAYVRPGDKGQLPVCNTGWGYFPLNLLKASLSVFRGVVDRVSVLRIMEPLEGAIIDVPRKGKTTSFNITWAMIGSGMDGPFDVYLNNTVVKTNIMNVRSTTVNTMKLEEKGLILKPGSLNVTVVASRGWTRFTLSKVMVDSMMPEPQSTASAFRIIQLNIM